MKDASDSVSALLRAHGLRVTAGRVRVLALLMSAREPLAIDEIASRASGVHLVTVYRILEQFVRTGLIYRADFRSGKASYEYQPHHHHHVTCTGCGAREAIGLCVQTEAARALAETKRFTSVDSHVLEFFGVCRACSTDAVC